MTRAPRSASCRVANGPAIACSSVTTVMPASGCTIGPLRDDRRGFHRQAAAMILRPQLHGPAVARRLAADEKRIDVEQRARGTEGEARDRRVGSMLAQEIEQQGGEQRTVHDQA